MLYKNIYRHQKMVEVYCGVKALHQVLCFVKDKTPALRIWVLIPF